MRIDIVTIFPRMFNGVLSESIIKRAREKGIIEVKVHNLRDFSKDKHRKVDGRPFGGGPGMVMFAEPFFDAVAYIKEKTVSSDWKSDVILLGPKGRRFDYKMAKRLSGYDQLIFLCGHYEGVDERVRQYLIDEEISIGDFILTGGEPAAMVVIDAVTRLLPGVLGNKDSHIDESFSNGLLEYPQYTRPADYKGMKVPSALLSGDHKKIKDWRRMASLKETMKYRPDLLK